MRLIALILICLGLQAGAGWVLHERRPNLEILPPVPTRAAEQAASLGDTQFLYRYLALEIQNAGDTGGRFTRMSDYDPAAVVAWLRALQRLDFRSQHYTFLAVRYFSQSREERNLRQLTAFIDEDVALAPDLKWYWQTQAVAIARDRIKDLDYALELSRKMWAFERYLPAKFAWALEMEAILLADMGRMDEARESMERAIETYGSRMSVYEQNAAQDFFSQLQNWKPKPAL